MTVPNEPYVLWLASAWPNRISPFNGDFVLRHAQATAAFVRIHVITVVRDEAGIVTKSVLREDKRAGKLTETVIYYYCPKGTVPVWSKFRSVLQFRSLFSHAIDAHVQEHGKPGFVHVQWGMKAGLQALRIKRKWGIPYFVTEHWTGFLPEATDNFNALPAILKRTWKKLLYGAAGCQVVSEALASAMRERFPGLKVMVIPNVVDTSVFYPREVILHPHRFIHISGLDAFKDPESLLHAFSLVVKEKPDAELLIYGARTVAAKAMITSLQLTAQVKLFGEKPQSELAEAICSSAALILYSRYETFGCVQAEANACGVPVIVTDIPVFRERVVAGRNGMLVPSNDPQSLADAMIRMISERANYSGPEMAQEIRSRFAYPVVGKIIAEQYQLSLSK